MKRQVPLPPAQSRRVRHGRGRRQLTTALQGASSSGAPVIDGKGFIYVAAQNGTNAAVLCFSTRPSRSTPTSAAASTRATATFTQADEYNSAQPNQLRPGPINGTHQYGQFSAAGNRVTFYNFGVGTGATRQIAGNLTEPQPVQATPNPDPNQAQQNLNSVTLPLHTNLVWYATTFLNTRPYNYNYRGFHCRGNGVRSHESRQLSVPHRWNEVVYHRGRWGGLNWWGQSLIAGRRTITSLALTTPRRLLTRRWVHVSATPSAGTGVMVVNGVKGLVALTQQLTLVTDNNRILEVDSQGKAVWGVDATSRPTQTGTTYVDFSHPTSLSQVTRPTTTWSPTPATTAASASTARATSTGS